MAIPAPGAPAGARSRRDVRAELAERVGARRAELEAAIMARIRDGADGLTGDEDPEYLDGLRTAVAAVVAHGLAGIEHGEEGVGAIPLEAVTQARRAARAGVRVETVIRRYLLGSSLLSDFVMQEAAASRFAEHGATVREMLAAQSAVLERLTEAIGAEHRHETERVVRSSEHRRAERVRRLLAGGRCDSAELGYELGAWHTCVVAIGSDAGDALKRLAATLRTRMLCVPREDDALWAWLGGSWPTAPADVERALRGFPMAGETMLALGEPAHGLDGWRLTHLQALAALRVALRDPRPLTRYADVALLASVLCNDALASSLVDIFLAPLGELDNGGAVLRETLRAYFAAERNASSAAAALGIARHTVQKRLRQIEEKLGMALRTRQAELEVALRVEELGAAEPRRRTNV